MNGEKVVREDMQRQSTSEIGFLFGKARRQACEASHTCAERQVVALNVRGRDEICVRSSTDSFSLNSFEFTRTVPFTAFFTSSVVFDFPAVINISPEHVFNDWNVSAPTIGRKLKASVNAITQVGNKLKRGVRFTFAERVRRDEFAFCDSQEAPLITVIGMLVRFATSLFLLHVSPRLINLHLSRANMTNSSVEDCFGFESGDTQNLEHGFRVDVIESGSSTDSASFSQTRENAIDSLFRNVERLADSFGLRECFAAAWTLKARRVLLAVASVNVWSTVASFWASWHGFLSSFLTRITVVTTMRLRALSGIYGVSQVKSQGSVSSTSLDSQMVPATRFERVTYGLADRRSILLSYAGIIKKLLSLLLTRLGHCFSDTHQRLCHEMARGFPAIHSFSVASRHANRIAAFINSLKNCVNASKCICVTREIVLLNLQRVSNLNWRPITISRLQNSPHGLRELEVVISPAREFDARHGFSKVALANQFGQACNRLLKLEDSLFELLPLDVEFRLFRVKLVARLNELVVFIAGRSKGLFPVSAHNSEDYSHAQAFVKTFKHGKFKRRSTLLG